LCFATIIAFNMTLTPSFARSSLHFFISILTCIGTDLIFNFRRQEKFVFPMSAAITSFGIAVVTDSPYIWPTALAAALAITSKNVLRFRGQHIFNPNNFGLSLVLFGMPEFASVGVPRFGGNIEWSYAIVGAGTILVVMARRWIVSLSYTLGFIAINTLSAWMLARPLWTHSLTVLSPGVQLVILFMITDPCTSPSRPVRQAVYGFAIAAVDHVLRLNHEIDSLIFALFLVAPVFNLTEIFLLNRTDIRPWKTSDMNFG
jgi:Na+-translocating ferredoxin:NAD+ oxidoreductase RnfD subunit